MTCEVLSFNIILWKRESQLTSKNGIFSFFQYLKIISYPKVILSVSGLLLMYSLTQLPNLKILVSMSDLTDQNMPSARDLRALKNDFHLLPGFFIMAKPKDELKANFKELQDWMTYQRQDPDSGIHSWFTPWDILFPQIGPGQMIFKKVLPSFEETKTLEKINKTPWTNILTDQNGKDAAVIVDFSEAGEPQKFGSFNLKKIRQFIDSIKSYPFKDLEIKIAGPAAFTYYAIEGVSFNTKLNFFFLFCIIFLFRFLFGTWKSGLLLSVTFLWSGILVHSLMVVFGYPMEILSSGLFAMLIVSSLEDFLFICHENAKGLDIKTSLSRLLLPCLMTSLTTVIGFGSLYFTDIDIISRFGLWASIGAILEWISIFFLLPSLMYFLKIENLVDHQKSDFVFLKKITHFWNSKRIPKFLSLSLLSTYLISAFLMFKFQVSDTPLSLFPKDHVLVKDFEYLSQSRQWQAEASIVFELEVDEQIQKNYLNEIEKIPNVKLIESIFDIKNYFVSFDQFGYEKAISNYIDTHPLNSRYRGDLLSYRHIVYFQDSEFSILKKTIHEIRSICQEKCLLVGEVISYNEFMDKIPLGLLKSLGGSLLLVALVLFILATYFKHHSPLMFTLGSLWGPSVLIILMWFLNIQINFLSCVFICMMVGLTGDNGIQFLFAERREGRDKGIEYHEICALQSGFILSFSCLFFMLSYFAPPREFGPLMCLGFLLSLFGDIWLTKNLTLTKKLR